MGGKRGERAVPLARPVDRRMWADACDGLTCVQKRLMYERSTRRSTEQPR